MLGHVKVKLAVLSYWFCLALKSENLDLVLSIWFCLILKLENFGLTQSKRPIPC